MKRVKFNVAYVVLIMASLAFFACSKAEDGAIGPEGPAGQTGPAGQVGETGPAGQDGVDGLNGGSDGTNGQDGADGVDGQDGVDGSDGQNGADGNANVMVSGWFSFESSDWSTNTQQTIASATKDAPEITQEVIDDAVILTYAQLGPGSGALMVQLPVTIGVTINGYQISDLGKIRFRITRSDGGTVSGSSSNAKYRYVIIPAGTSTTGKSSIDFKKMTYEEVMDHFGLDY